MKTQRVRGLSFKDDPALRGSIAGSSYVINQSKVGR